jgi:prepilin-type N-terminal cleavage/methylation domain-containing protein
MPTWVSGFTLVEMIVSLGIFTIALFIATSSFLAVVNADRKARGTRIALDNLNLTLEDMSRKMKTGNSYSCGGNPGVADCTTTPIPSVFALTDQNGLRIIYKRGIGNGAVAGGVGLSGCGAGYSATEGCVLRSEDGGGSFLPATSPEINITSLKFVVRGSALFPDKTQPTVLVGIEGALGNQVSTQVDFKIQTTITQRAYDH